MTGPDTAAETSRRISGATRRAAPWIVSSGLFALLATGCAMPAEMKLEPEGRACPAVEVEAAPEAEAGLEGRAIAWYGPVGSSDERDNARWCGTVGPSIVDSNPRARLPQPGRADSVAVVSWNIQIGGGDVARFLEEELGYRCPPDSWEPTSSFSHFVLLFQEAYRRSEAVPDAPESFRFPPRIVPASPPEGWPDIAQMARRCGLALLYVPSQRNGGESWEGGREDKGNAILSTLPLSDPAAIELPFEAGRKVAVAATIQMPSGVELRVVSVHLDVASTLYRTLTTGNTARLRQTLGLIDALALMEGARAEEEPASCGVVPHPIAAVAAGDFNTWSAGESAIDQLYLCFPASPPWDGEPTRGSFPTDFIFFRTAEDGLVRYLEGSERRIEDRYGSDHHARIAWFGRRG